MRLRGACESTCLPRLPRAWLAGLPGPIVACAADAPADGGKVRHDAGMVRDSGAAVGDAAPDGRVLPASARFVPAPALRRVADVELDDRGLSPVVSVPVGVGVAIRVAPTS